MEKNTTVLLFEPTGLYQVPRSTDMNVNLMRSLHHTGDGIGKGTTHTERLPISSTVRGFPGEVTRNFHSADVEMEDLSIPRLINKNT